MRTSLGEEVAAPSASLSCLDNQDLAAGTARLEGKGSSTVDLKIYYR